MPQHEPTRKSAKKAVAPIPDKLYFRIGEVSQLCGLPAYVLRFWETEFSQLKPHKSGTGQRLYRRRDVEMALHVKKLLYEEGYTIPGARQALKAEARQGTGQPELPLKFELAPEPEAPAPSALKKERARLLKLKHELREILDLLSQHTQGGKQQPAAAGSMPPAAKRPSMKMDGNPVRELF